MKGMLIFSVPLSNLRTPSRFAMPYSTQSAPGGFLFVFFGLLAWVFAGLAGYVAWLVHQREEIQRQVTSYSYGLYCALSISGFLTGLLLIVIGMKLALRTGAYDSRDPKEPSLKW